MVLQNRGSVQFQVAWTWVKFHWSVALWALRGQTDNSATKRLGCSLKWRGVQSPAIFLTSICPLVASGLATTLLQWQFRHCLPPTKKEILGQLSTKPCTVFVCPAHGLVTCTCTPISQQVACYSASEIAISMSCHQLTLLAHPRTPSESTKSSLGNCLLKSGVKPYNASCPGRYNSTSPTKVLILQLIPQWLINFWQALVWKLWWSFPESQYHLSNISNHNRRQRLAWLPKAGFTMS